MKKVNNFQLAKVQPQGFCLICCQFQSGAAYKKACNSTENHSVVLPLIAAYDLFIGIFVLKKTHRDYYSLSFCHLL